MYTCSTRHVCAAHDVVCFNSRGSSGQPGLRVRWSAEPRSKPREKEHKGSADYCAKPTKKAVIQQGRLTCSSFSFCSPGSLVRDLPCLLWLAMRVKNYNAPGAGTSDALQRSVAEIFHCPLGPHTTTATAIHCNLVRCMTKAMPPQIPEP